MFLVWRCDEFMDTQHDERESGECHRQVQDLPQCVQNSPRHDSSILRRKFNPSYFRLTHNQDAEATRGRGR